MDHDFIMIKESSIIFMHQTQNQIINFKHKRIKTLYIDRQSSENEFSYCL